MALWILFSFMVSVTNIMSQVTGLMFPINCPPEFPNFELAFKRSLQNENLQRMFKNVKETNRNSLSCISSYTLIRFNKKRCLGNMSLNMSTWSNTRCSTTFFSKPLPTVITEMPLKTTSASSTPGTKKEPVVTAPESFLTTATTKMQKTTVSQTVGTSSKLHSSKTGAGDVSTTWRAVDSANGTSEPRVVIVTPSKMEAKTLSSEKMHLIVCLSIFGGLLGSVLIILIGLYLCRKKLQQPNLHSSNMIPKMGRQPESFIHTRSMLDSKSFCNGQTGPKQMMEGFRKELAIDSSTPHKDDRLSFDFLADTCSSSSSNNNNSNSVHCANHTDSIRQFRVSILCHGLYTDL